VGSSQVLRSKSSLAATGLRLWAALLVVLAFVVDLVLVLEVDPALALGLGLDVVLVFLPLTDFVAILLSPNE
jgi:hypothetical protein